MHIGIDIGTQSLRAGLFGINGECLYVTEKNIPIYKDGAQRSMQNSDEIKKACTESLKFIKEYSEKNMINLTRTTIGFTGTCSLVVLGENDKPLTVNAEPEVANIIMWMDHRAIKEADVLNKKLNNGKDGDATHDALKGEVSPENDTPKLMWIAKNIGESPNKLLSLPDFMTYFATGNDTRSAQNLTCKWVGLFKCEPKVELAWNDAVFRELELTHFKNAVGHNFAAHGGPAIANATGEIEKILGETIIATSMIDAHAGTLGCIDCEPKAGGEDIGLNERLVIIAGTSQCHLLNLYETDNAVTIDAGVWGPYWNVVVPGMWTYEAGQSAAGQLIDYLIERHAAYDEAVSKAGTQSVHNYLSIRLTELAKERNVPLHELSKDVQVLPDFNGNRSPIGDATLTGLVAGLTFAHALDDLAILYLAAVQAVAYGTKHIIEKLETCLKHKIKRIHMCGGLTKSKLYIQMHSDACQIPILIPEQPHSVLLGAAMLGAAAVRKDYDIHKVMKHMSGYGRMVEPNKQSSSYHERKYRAYKTLLKAHMASREIMKGV